MSVVEHSRGYTELKLAEHLSRSIREAQDETEAVLRENTEATLTELKRIQMQQELTGLEIQFSSIQSEIRLLEREKQTKRIRRLLKDLQTDGLNVVGRIERLEAQLGITPEPLPQERSRSAPFSKRYLIVILLLVACFVCSVVLQLTFSSNSKRVNTGNVALPIAEDLQERVQDTIRETQNVVQEVPTDVSTQAVEATEAESDVGEVEGSEETEATRSIWVAHVIENSNLRRGPSTDFDVVGSAVAGTELKVYARTSDGWLQVDEKGETWIGLNRVELEVDAIALPTVVFATNP
jgi:hypothetical protein